MEAFLGITKWMLRLTDDKDLLEVETLIKGLKPNKYIIGSELSQLGKRHFHIYIEGTYTKEMIRGYLNENGYKGNKMYNLKEANDSSKVKRYCIKDGEFIYHGIDDELMKTWKQLSHKKLKDGYADELTKLEEKYMSKNMYSENNFGTDVIMLQVRYGLKPKRNNHVPYMNYMRIKRDGRIAAGKLNAEWMNT